MSNFVISEYYYKRQKPGTLASMDLSGRDFDAIAARIDYKGVKINYDYNEISKRVRIYIDEADIEIIYPKLYLFKDIDKIEIWNLTYQDIVFSDYQSEINTEFIWKRGNDENNRSK